MKKGRTHIEVSNKYGNPWITSQDRVFMKNFSYKSKSSKALDEDLESDLERDLQGHSKVNSKNLNRNHYFLPRIRKERKILRPETWLSRRSQV